MPILRIRRSSDARRSHATGHGRYEISTKNARRGSLPLVSSSLEASPSKRRESLQDIPCNASKSPWYNRYTRGSKTVVSLPFGRRLDTKSMWICIVVMMLMLIFVVVISLYQMMRRYSSENSRK
ncbi:hypothetical protein DPMN_056652 [Dreissena polymorpha]|uniref:Uncharacterized protein n=1 Tax=Dreissena polymorpha TaxID=45954 RepID=A0A9D4CSU4_DREPO|nr:hypothetical protein DPMN_056597 [Dreissena polymorpha]KAH3730661.1 hypothetical protein DPMN_056652 [Dreissena polymorpha]